MIFEYDKRKGAINKVKHGVDFNEAQEIFRRGAVVLHSRYPREMRMLAIGRIADLTYTAIFTEREARIRIISCRRSRIEEIELYEKEKAADW